MSKTKRKIWKTLNLFAKQFKRPCQLLANAMPDGFTDDEYIAAFHDCYPHLWQDLEMRFKEYQKRDNRREQRGFKRLYNFPAPPKYIRQRAQAVIMNVRRKGSTIPMDERLECLTKLRLQGERKFAKKTKRFQKRIEIIQQVKPMYVNHLIKTYFDIKHRNPTNVNERMIIIREAGKYKCRQTVEFLYKINASERNFSLRNQAFQILIGWGFIVELHKNRKGKRKPGDNTMPVIAENPEQLLHQIYSSQMEKESRYDVFMSHSSKDKALILDIMRLVNKQNLSVYVDWINDREGLPRDLACAETAKVIIERIKKSTVLLYIHTENSLGSQWTPWEIGYADALGRKIAVCFMNRDNIPEYLKMYNEVVIDNGALVIGEHKISIAKWAKSHK